jgi:3-deoxy-manno-octulosonate cytidylyltransferase (CMP-KDO synthetase)
MTAAPTPRVVAVVPARMASSRFPGKPLVSIAGLAMVEHVRRRSRLARRVHEVVVATCDPEIRDAVERVGGHAVMTAATHERCTTRVAEAMASLPGDVVVIVQGDEPLLVPNVVDEVVAPLLDRPDIDCTNLLSPLVSDADRANPDIVKAAVNRDGFVMFLSRAPIPFVRVPSRPPVFRQTGIMAMRSSLLREYVELPETPLERIESIDMLRLLEHGRSIYGVVMDAPTVGVDRPEDVARVEAFLRSNAEQADLHRRIIDDGD